MMIESYQGEDQKKYHFLFMIRAEEAAVTDEMILSHVDPKVLFMTARPGRCRAFIPAQKFLRTWVQHNQAFLDQPPMASMIHSGMKENADRRAEAIQIQLSNPKERGSDGWQFAVQKLSPGRYRNLVLFIDWPASLQCPEPIRIEVPSLFGESDV